MPAATAAPAPTTPAPAAATGTNYSTTQANRAAQLLDEALSAAPRTNPRPVVSKEFNEMFRSWKAGLSAAETLGTDGITIEYEHGLKNLVCLVSDRTGPALLAYIIYNKPQLEITINYPSVIEFEGVSSEAVGISKVSLANASEIGKGLIHSLQSTSMSVVDQWSAGDLIEDIFAITIGKN
jgi:hypothetical protein